MRSVLLPLEDCIKHSPKKRNNKTLLRLKYYLLDQIKSSEFDTWAATLYNKVVFKIIIFTR